MAEFEEHSEAQRPIQGDPDDPRPEALTPRESADHADPRPIKRAVPWDDDHLEEVRGGTRLSPLTLLLSAVLALVFGGVGAWLYDAFLAARLGATPADGVAAAEAATGGELALRVDRLDERLEAIRARVEDPTATPRPAQAVADDSRIAELADRVDELESRLGSLPQRVEENRDRIATTAQALDRIEARVALLREPSESAAAPDGPATLGPTDAPGHAVPPEVEPVERAATEAPAATESVEAALARGAGLFEGRRYGEARDAFREALESHPDDARLWYYAALADGFASGEWEGEAVRLVRRGIERERAGTPSTSEIDAAFAGLTPSTGKDWLAAYRRRAR